MRRLSILLLFLLLGSFTFAENPSYCDITVKVVKLETGKPVRNASVILHPVSSNGKQEKGGLNLKTDSEGKASLNSIPYGKLRVQVIAHGLQTFGQDYDINEPTKEIEIKLKPPQTQYSIYDDKHPAPNAPQKK